MAKRQKPALKQETIRNFRCNDRLWKLAKDKAATEGRSLSDLLRSALVEYVTK